jgi:excisionase family DNA binding protein
VTDFGLADPLAFDGASTRPGDEVAIADDRRKGTITVTAITIPPQTISVDEAAAALGINRGTAYQGVRDGDIPSIRVGRRIRVPVAALSRMLNGLGITDPTDEQLVGWSLEVNPTSGEVNPAQTLDAIADTTGLDVEDVDAAFNRLFSAGWLRLEGDKLVVSRPTPGA